MSEYTVQRFGKGYAVVVPLGNGKRRRLRLTAKDRPGAEAEARVAWAGSRKESWTVGRVVESYIDAREAAGIASTARQRDAWKAMKDYWGRIDPAMIDDEMARGYVRQRKMAPATTRYELSMLAVALRWAAEKDYIRRAKAVWRPTAPERKLRHLTHAQFKRWFEQVKAPHARLYVLLGIYTMARPTAILELTWRQVDWEHETVNLNPPGRAQTKKRRPVVPLNDEAMEALRAAYEARQTEYVIERGAKPVACIKKAFQAASARSGIKVTPYMLRHTGAVWAAERGAALPELAQFMGHDDDRTTQKHYARFTPTHLRGVSDKVRLGVN